MYNPATQMEECIINNSYSTCQLGTTVAILAFIIAVGRGHIPCQGYPVIIITSGSLIGEYYFDMLPSTDNKKQFVFADLIFSGFFALLYLVSFCSLTHQWRLSPDTRGHYGHHNIGASIAFSFFSVFVWVS